MPVHIYRTYICFPKYMFIKHAFVSKKCSGTWYNDKEDINPSIMVITAGAKNIITGCRE